MCYSSNCNVRLLLRLTPAQYEQVADETLDSLTEIFEDLPERLDCDPQYDVTFSVSLILIVFFLRLYKVWICVGSGCLYNQFNHDINRLKIVYCTASEP